MKLTSIYPTLLLTFAFGLMLTGCDTHTRKGLDIDSMITYIPVQTSPDGRWGMMSVSGQLAFADEFTEMPTVAVNGLFSAQEGDSRALYSVGDQPRLVNNCEGMLQIGYCNEGLIPMVKGSERIIVTTTDGTPAFTLDPINGKEITSCSSMYSDGVLVVTDSEGHYGCVDVTGSTLIAPKYHALSDFSGGYAIATTAEGDDHYIVIDRADQTVCDVKQGYKVESRVMKNGEFIISDSTGLLCFMDIKGQVEKLPAKVKEVGDYTENLYAFRGDNGFWGLMSRKNNNQLLMRPKFVSLTILPTGIDFLVNLDGIWSIIDLRGKKSVTFGDSYKTVYVTGFTGSVKYIAQDNAGWVLMDDAGAEIRPDFNIYNIGYEPNMQPGTIGSSFVESTSIVDEILDQITLNSLCGIQLNAISNKWYKKQSPDDFVDSKEFVPDSIPEFPSAADVAVLGVTDRTISAALRYDKATESIVYAFLPSNTVSAIEIDITTKRAEAYAKTKDDLIEGLTEMGYKVVEDTEDSVLLRSHYANLEISPTDNDKTITILMYKL